MAGEEVGEGGNVAEEMQLDGKGDESDCEKDEQEHHAGAEEDHAAGSQDHLLLVTTHPSAVLRVRGRDGYDEAFAGLVDDLRLVAPFA